LRPILESTANSSTLSAEQIARFRTAQLEQSLMEPDYIGFCQRTIQNCSMPPIRGRATPLFRAWLMPAGPLQHRMRNAKARPVCPVQSPLSGISKWPDEAGLSFTSATVGVGQSDQPVR
jgi:hypothetical protein